SHRPGSALLFTNAFTASLSLIRLLSDAIVIYQHYALVILLLLFRTKLQLAPKMSITIIGGTGIELSTHPALKNIHDEVVSTRWGKALVTRAMLGEREILFLHRHADPEPGKRHIPPHKI